MKSKSLKHRYYEFELGIINRFFPFKNDAMPKVSLLPLKLLIQGIEKYFRKAAKLNEKFPEDKINEKYAACVPHLMIYPEGKINVQSTKSITLV